MNARVLLRGALHALGLIDDLGVWIDAGTSVRLRACAYPRTDRALAGLAAEGIAVLVNLHERSHAPTRLAAQGLREVHVPVRDFPTDADGRVARGSGHRPTRRLTSAETGERWGDAGWHGR